MHRLCLQVELYQSGLLALNKTLSNRPQIAVNILTDCCVHCHYNCVYANLIPYPEAAAYTAKIGMSMTVLNTSISFTLQVIPG